MSSLENGLTILRLLNRDRPVLRVGEVCRELAMPKSSVSRLLRTLAEFGLLEQLPHDPGYVVGPHALLLASLYLGRHSLIELADGALDALVAELGFTGYVSVLSGVDIVLVRLRQGSYPLRHIREIGARLPAWKTAMGQVLLARLGDDEVRARFAARAGDGSEPVDTSELLARLAGPRRTGFILAGSVLTPGVSTISTALRDKRSGDLVALALSYPDSAADPALQERMTERVVERARELGSQIGDPFWTAWEAKARPGLRGGDDRGDAGQVS